MHPSLRLFLLALTLGLASGTGAAGCNRGGDAAKADTSPSPAKVEKKKKKGKKKKKKKKGKKKNGKKKRKGASTGAVQSAPPPLEVDEKNKLLYEAQGKFSKIRVRQTGPKRTLFFAEANGTEWPQTILNVKQPHRPAMAYLRHAFVGLLHRPDPSSTLIVGLGGGAMVSILRHVSPKTKITAVEIDPAVVRVAAEWFGVKPNATTDIVTADGIEFVQEAEDRAWDIIFMDAFLEPSAKGTDSSGVPQGTRTVEWLTTLSQRLSEGGIVVFNLHNKSALAKHMKAITTAFPHVVVYPVPKTGNRIAVASLVAQPDHAELVARAEKLKGTPAGPLKLHAILARNAPAGAQ